MSVGDYIVPTTKARKKPQKDPEKMLLEISPVSSKKKQEILSVPEAKAVKPKTKPKPKAKTKVVKVKEEKPLQIYQLAALYEFYHRNTVVKDYSKWPVVTIAEATELVKGIKPSDLESWPEVDRLYKNLPTLSEKDEDLKDLLDDGFLVEHEYVNVRDFQNSIIQKEIFVGISIPLFIEHFKIDSDDPVMLTLLYSWVAYVKLMIDRRKKQGNVKSRHASTVKEGEFCVEVECNVEQAKILERYCAASHGTLIACREYLKSLGNRAPKRIDKISSKLATQIRKEHSFEDVPRSLVLSALNGYTQKTKFDPSKEFKKDVDRFYLKDSFKLQEESLTVGKAKDIAIRKVVGGKKLTLKISGVSVQRVTPLIYTITVQYDSVEVVAQKYGIN